MFVLPFLLYAYMNQENFSTFLNTSGLTEWSESLPLWLQTTSMPSLTLPLWLQTTSMPSLTLPVWLQNTTMPTLVVPSSSDMAPYAVYYFLSGALLFLGSSYMILSRARYPDYRTIDGIATMSDFTKTNIMKYTDGKANRELVSLIETNGMEPEEFLNIFAGNRKRARYISETT